MSFVRPGRHARRAPDAAGLELQSTMRRERAQKAHRASTPQGRRLLRTAGVAAALLGAGLLVGSTPAASASTYWVPVSRTLVVHGHGYGHGHGMSQYGAEGAARRGLTWRQIVGFYYPGTTVGAMHGDIRVLITADTGSDVVVKPASGLRVTDLGNGSSFSLPAPAKVDRWRITPKAGRPSVSVVQEHRPTGWRRWRVLTGDGQFTSASGIVTLVLPSGSVHSYRGALRASSPSAGSATRDTVDVLPLDDYVRGVVAAEMPASWHQQALRSQAMAARTYAAYYMVHDASRYYQICDTTACQVYGGVGSETTATDEAVAATAGDVVDWRGSPAFTQFASSDGGWTSDGGEPYLVAQKDPYDGWSGNPVHSWSLSVSASTFQRAYPSIGQLQDLRVTKRDGHGQWGGRVQQLRLVGSRGAVSLTGDDVRWLFGLRSDWFSFKATPIITKWRALGGRRSVLGDVTGPEVAVTSARHLHGARQDFAHGRMLWARSIGAKPIIGPVLTTWKHKGGVRSKLGFPLTGPIRSTGHGWRQRFQHHRMLFWSKATGTHILTGAILATYQARHFTGSRLGYPVTSVHAVTGGRAARFQGGRIVWTRATGKVTVTIKH